MLIECQTPHLSAQAAATAAGEAAVSAKATPAQAADAAAKWASYSGGDDIDLPAGCVWTNPSSLELRSRSRPRLDMRLNLLA